MDDLVLHAQREIALDGQSGKFWYLIDEFQSRSVSQTSETSGVNTKPSDEKFRQFFWNNFIHEDGTQLYTHTKHNADEASQVDVTRAEYIPFSELELLDTQNAGFKEVIEQHRNTLRIVASTELQRSAVLGNEGEALSSVSTQVYQVLQTITAAREFGATQAQLAKHHDVDPRSMFHFIKVLIDTKFIVKIPVTTEGKYTLLCLNQRFAKKNAGYIGMTSEETFSSAGKQLITGDGGKRFEGLLKSDSMKVSYYSGLIKQKLTDILSRAKNQVMLVEDILKALDLSDMNAVQNRWFNRQIELLCKLKYIKRVRVEGHARCIQLLRPYGMNMTVDETEKDQLNLKTVIADDTSQNGICIDTSIEHQVFKLIVDSRAQGIIAKEIRQNLNRLNTRLLARILSTLCKPVPDSKKALVNRVVEFVGRERRYRYYSEDAFKEGVADDHKHYLEGAKVRSSANASGISLPKAATQIPTLSDTTAAIPSTSSSGIIEDTTEIPDTAIQTVSSTPTGATTTSSSTQQTGSITTSTRSMVTATPERYISVELLRRRKILLAIVEEKKIVELQASLVTEYQTLKRKMFPDQGTATVIDRKTLYRTISILEQEGHVRLFKIQNLPSTGSNNISKTFVLHPDVDPESEQVKAFVRDCSNRHLLFGTLANRPMQPIESVALEVETLDEMQQRLGEEFYKGPAVPLADVGAVKPKESESKSKVYAQDGGDYSIEYGWIHAKMMRALVFHRYLLDRLELSDRRLFAYPNHSNVFNTAAIFEILPLRIFLLIIGFNQELTAENRSFLDENKESNVAISTLPDHIRRHTLPSTHFKQRLRVLFEILDALSLVTPIGSVPHDQGSLKYAENHLVLNAHYEIHLHVRAPLHAITPDLIYEDLANRKLYDLLSPGGCKDFWTDLQAAASSMKVPTENTSRAALRPWNEIRVNFLRNLCNRRIWADPLRVTSLQRDMLMRYVNKTTRYVPSIKDPRMSTISKETGLSIDHIAQFFKAVATAWYNDSLAKDNNSRTRLTRLNKAGSSTSSLKAKNVGVGKRVVSAKTHEDRFSKGVASVESNRQIGPSTAINVTASSSTNPLETAIPSSRTSTLSSDSIDNEDAGKVPKGYAVGQPKKRRVARVPWTDAEDDKMLLALAITRYISRALNLRFSWFGVARALDGTRTPEICRHRYDKLMKETSLLNRVESYMTQFGQVFPEISQRFSVEPNLQLFDPRPIMSYFQPNLELATDAEVVQSNPLLASPMENESQYLVRHLEPYAKLYIEDRLHYEMSLPRRMAVLMQYPATLRSSFEKELDEASDKLGEPHDIECTLENHGNRHVVTIRVREEVLAQEHIILGVIKAIYSMPPEKRTRKLIRAILESFPYESLQSTCALAKDWKVLASVKSLSFRIPGQKVRRSERFTLLMAGSYPRKMTLAAAEVDEYTRRTKERLFQADAGPSEMMVLLNDIAMDEQEISMKPPSGNDGIARTDDHGTLFHFDIQLKSKKYSLSPTVRALMTGQQSNQKIISLSGDTALLTDHDGTSACSDSGVKSSEDPWEKAREWSKMQVKKMTEFCSSSETGELCRVAYDIIASSESSGMLLQDIKYGIYQAGMVASDKELLDCIRTLEEKYDILVKVGMTERRYVIFGWHQSWTIDFKEGARRADVDENGLSTEAGLRTNPWNCIVPRMWRALDGGFDKATFEKALHAVLTFIVERPGVSKGALLSHFSMILLGVEMDDLLEELESRGAIEAQHGIQPKAPSLFSKRGVYTRCDRDTIDARKVTNYFPRPSYYLYIDSSLVEESTKDKEEDRRRRPRKEYSGIALKEDEEEDLEDDEEDGDDDREEDEDIEGKEKGKEREQTEEDEEDERLTKKSRSINKRNATLLSMLLSFLLSILLTPQHSVLFAFGALCSLFLWSTPYDPHPGPSSKTAQLQQQVNDVVGIMQQNIDSVRDRGEKLDTLQHKTTDLEQGAVQFRKGASGVRRQMWWKNMKWRLIVAIGIILLLVIIIVPIVKK
ncbi:hypothetical protein FBU30_004974 [Linnemannia zychae]|nr:hypothetical protein FBU30_004974 [Linnemannia zychae]